MSDKSKNSTSPISSPKIELKFKVNGGEVTVRSHSMARLLDVLREDLNLTGTKEGCGEGECGACSVFVNGRLVNSCLVPMRQMQNCEVETVESLSAVGSELDALQKSFLKHGGAQCGICTPGMLMAATSLLRKISKPNAAEVREALAGNLCRCTGYNKIIDAVVDAHNHSNSESHSGSKVDRQIQTNNGAAEL